MKRIFLAGIGTVVLALTGCGSQGTALAPPKPGATNADAGKQRKLVVKAPTEQNVTQDQTNEFTVSVDRDNFNGPVTIDIRNLPPGVTVTTQDLTIPADKNSVTVTVKAAANAATADDHKVTVAAKAADMPEAVADFKMDVKAKK